MPANDNKPMLTFAEAVEFRDWLRENHAGHGGIWLRYFKKASGQPSIDHKEAVQEALCWGWIDGQARPLDEVSWLVKFTPRGPRSIWSQVNVGLVERLSAEGRMMPAGMAVVEAAKADGRWQVAYASSSTFEMPEDFMKALAKKPKALAFFESLNKTNRYAIYHRLHTAKRPETRAKRMKDFLAMLQRGEKLH
jgi:uncharacterized protein YdeI (YjbR/CyaY-like superfamily)